MEYDLALHHCHVLTKDFDILFDQSVAIKDGVIEVITPYNRDIELNSKENLQSPGKLLMPGLIDGHTHTCQQLLRGRVSDEFPMIWARFLVPFESELTEDDVFLSAQLACLEMIKSGTTAFAESGGRYMHRVADAVMESGMRACIARSTMDLGGAVAGKMVESLEDAVRHSEDLYKAYHGKANRRIEVWFALRQVMTCSPELIQMVGDKAKEYNTGIHMHLYEHRDEVSFCLRRYKMRPANLIDILGAMGPHLITAHNVVMAESDIELYAERGVKAIHCPHANLTSHGFSKTPSLLAKGVSIGLGSDGSSSYSSSIFEAARILRLAMNAYWGLPAFDPLVMTCREVLEMATIGGARAIQHEQDLGTVEVGKKADLILVNLRQPHMMPTHNLINTLVESASSHDVTDSIIDGKIVMKNREVLTLDEEKILRESEERMKALSIRAGWEH